MNTPLIILCALVAVGFVVTILDTVPWGTQTYTISTRELSNTAAGSTTTNTTTTTGTGTGMGRRS